MILPLLMVIEKVILVIVFLFFLVVNISIIVFVSPSCIHTPAASDRDKKGTGLKCSLLDSFVVLYIVIVYHRCCCASLAFDTNKQDIYTCNRFICSNIWSIVLL